MASLNIDDPRAVELADRLSSFTGETVTEVVVRSLEERLEHYRRPGFDQPLYDDLMKLTDPAISVVDERPDWEILGYDESGGF